MRRERGFAFAVLLAGLAGVLIGAGLVWLWVGRQAPQQYPYTPLEAPATGAVCPVSAQSQDAITAAVAKVGPAVVNIDTTFRPPKDARAFEPFPREGEGSGFIIDGQHGYILTNAHVVKNAAQVMVQLPDGRSFRAQKVGSDPLTEVAVIRIPAARNLPAAALGDSDALPIGAWVIAIGNPFGFQNTVTVGVLSAKERQITGPTGVTLQNLMQTDASINPGNSGGALVDVQARVVGIPTAMFEPARGIGFAVPINVARQVAERLIKKGKMPWLGIGYRDAAPAEVGQLGLGEAKRLVVVQVASGGPADRAGARVGDVILSVDGARIAEADDLGAAIRAHDVGATVRITVLRSRREVPLEVKLGAVPESIPTEVRRE